MQGLGSDGSGESEAQCHDHSPPVHTHLLHHTRMPLGLHAEVRANMTLTSPQNTLACLDTHHPPLSSLPTVRTVPNRCWGCGGSCRTMGRGSMVLCAPRS